MYEYFSNSILSSDLKDDNVNTVQITYDYSVETYTLDKISSYVNESSLAASNYGDAFLQEAIAALENIINKYENQQPSVTLKEEEHANNYNVLIIQLYLSRILQQE